MKNTTKLLIVIIVVVICIIAVIIGLLILSNRQKLEEENPTTEAFDELEKVVNKNLFYQVEQNINTYLKYVISNQQESQKAIASNSEIKLQREYTTGSSFQAQEMYALDKISNITVYVKGVVRFQAIEDSYYFIVHFDYGNNAFEIVNIQQEEYEKTTQNQINQQYKKDISITKNKFNEIKIANITDFEMLKRYFEDYRFKAIYQVEEAFSLIEEQYRQRKFNSDINKYKEYIETNKTSIQDANIIKHGVKKDGQWATYICIDQFNNYYQIKETGINQYTIILDNYTLEDEEFVQKYNQLSEKEKVVSCMDKIMKLINSKDYETLYQYLNTDYKNKSFATIDSFKQYLQENFFEENIVGIYSMKKQGNQYIIVVPYKESLSKAAEEDEKTFVIKLGQNTNFEFSINL